MNSITSRLPFAGITARQLLRIVIASASRRPCRTCLSMYTSAPAGTTGLDLPPAACTGRRPFRPRSAPSLPHAGLEIDEHTSKMGMEFQYCKNQCAPAPAKIGDHVRPRKIPRPRDGSVIFCGSRAHDGTKDRVSFRIL